MGLEIKLNGRTLGPKDQKWQHMIDFIAAANEFDEYPSLKTFGLLYSIRGDIGRIMAPLEHIEHTEYDYQLSESKAALFDALRVLTAWQTDLVLLFGQIIDLENLCNAALEEEDDASF